MLTKIQMRRDTASDWTNQNTVLAQGEIGVETDTLKFKIGDGATAWTLLAYQGSEGPPGPVGPAFVVYGTRVSPELITAIGGIPTTADPRAYMFISGSGGPVTISANPQIEAGDAIGQELLLQGGANAVTIQDGNGLELNGQYVLQVGSRIMLAWDGTVWGEVSRNDI